MFGIKKQSKAKKRRLRRLATQFVEYLVGGGAWFWSGYFIIIYVSDYWQPFNDTGKDLFLANIIGNGVGITLNFIVQYFWTFRGKHQKTITFAAKRYLIYTFLNAFILNFILLYILKQQFGIDPKYSQFITSGFFTFWNYFWYKVWVFPEPEHPTKKYAKPRVRKVPRHIVSQH